MGTGGGIIMDTPFFSNEELKQWVYEAFLRLFKEDPEFRADMKKVMSGDKKK